MGRLIFLLLGVVCASCLDPTQITVKITTNYTCADTNTGVLVGGIQVLSGGAFTATKEKCLSDGEVGSMVVVPSGNSSDDVYLRILAGVDGTKPDACLAPTPPMGSSCIEARRILRFVAHRKLELPVALDRSCINIRCGERETCVKGKCANAVVTDPECIADPSTCPDAAAPSMDSGVDSPPPVVTARLLAAGFDQACAVRSSDGALICWGKTLPAVVMLPHAIGPIKHVAIGAQHTCASDGAAVTCWGSNAKGQTGGTQPVNLGSNIIVGGLIAGDSFSCILDVTKNPHATRCWGAVLDDSQRPNEKVIYQLGPPVLGDPGFDAIAAGARHICGYLPNTGGAPTLYCWGDNAQKQSHTGSASQAFYKPNIVSNVATTLLGAGFDHSGAGGPNADPNGNRTFAWGGNLGLAISTVPDQIVFGEQHLCLREGTAVRCANGMNIGLTTVAFPAMTSIAAGRAFTCVLATTGKIYCSGALPAYPSSSNPYEIVLPP